MNSDNLISRAENTWCPGCGNFTIQRALKEVLVQMAGEGFPLEQFVLVAGIGQHAKIFDFMNVNGFYALHGRTIPVATGIKIANPDLTVLCVTGDGDCYAEGLEHLIFAAKRNVDITVIVNNNRVYGLTTGQYTPTSPYQFPGRSTPGGVKEYPLNPMELMLSAGAGFIGRAYTRQYEGLQRVMHEGLMHRGFSFIDILQICVTYNNLTEYYNSHVYAWEEDTVRDFDAACVKAREWDYNRDAGIGLGVLYRHDAPTFEENHPVPEPLPSDQREEIITRILEKRV